MIKQKKTIHWYQLTCKREGEKKKKEEEEAEEEGKGVCVSYVHMYICLHMDAAV